MKLTWYGTAALLLEHGVPVDVLIQHVTMKLRTMRGGAA